MIKIIENDSQYHKHTNNHSHVKLQSERFKANYKTTSNSTYHHSSFRTSEVPSAVFGTKNADQLKTVLSLH